VPLKKSYPLLEKTDPWICTASKLTLAVRVVNGIYRKHLKKHGVTMSQLSILMVAGKMKKISQSDLGKILRLERSTVTRDLLRLIKSGYLVKSGIKNRPVIEMTDAGAQYIEGIIPDWLAATEEARAKLGDDGEISLNLVLQKLVS
jgi:DNA-binding MarR family transcriptional regulator